MTKEEIIIVDEEDNIIGYKKRGTLNPEDIYRVSSLWVENSQGDILLAQRAFTKSHNPGKWGPAVAGTVDKGETYDSNIIKETEEEIGITGIKFEKTEKIRRMGKHTFFNQRYFALINKPIKEFTIQKEEVEQIKWFTKDELIALVKNDPEKVLAVLKEYVQNNS